MQRLPGLLVVALVGSGCQGAAAPLGPQEKAQTETVTIPGTKLTFGLVRIPGGPTTIGSPESDPDHRPDEKERSLELGSYWIATRTVTWAEFNAFRMLPAAPKDLDGVTRPTKADSYFGDSGMPAEFREAARPVTNVRWHGAVQYCEWLSRKTGRYFRLPTDAEWEHAARAGQAGILPEALDGHAWYAKNSGEEPHVGGKKQPNAFGLWDMAGNVWQYVLEFHDAPEYSPVVRGGCWSSPARELRFAHRQTVQYKWFEEDTNLPRSVWWLTTPTVSVGIRMVCAADASDRNEREAYASKIQVTITGHREKRIRIGASDSPWRTVTGEVQNAGDRALEELEIRVHYLGRDGQPHLWDDTGAKPGRATFSKAWPVLAHSALEGEVRPPLRPGQFRAFAIDLPYSYDLETQKDPKIQFGGVATGLKFLK